MFASSIAVSELTTLSFAKSNLFPTKIAIFKRIKTQFLPFALSLLRLACVSFKYRFTISKDC
jgi:hypothetical protein